MLVRPPSHEVCPYVRIVEWSGGGGGTRARYDRRPAGADERTAVGISFLAGRPMVDASGEEMNEEGRKKENVPPTPVTPILRPRRSIFTSLSLSLSLTPATAPLCDSPNKPSGIVPSPVRACPTHEVVVTGAYV